MTISVPPADCTLSRPAAANANATSTPIAVEFNLSTLDLSTLKCFGARSRRLQLSYSQLERLSPETQKRYSAGSELDPRLLGKLRCKCKVVYLIFPPETPNDPLPACNDHFNEYFESHDIGADMVMRLSDDEDDFTTGDGRSRSKRKRNSGRDGGRDARDNEPLCQVPKPRR